MMLVVARPTAVFIVPFWKPLNRGPVGKPMTVDF